MPAFSQKPHVSAALVQLQRTVSLCAMVVLLCACAQLMIFGCAHFTQIRWVNNETPAQQQRLHVVSGGKAAQVRVEAPAAGIVNEEARAAAPQASTTPEPRQASQWDKILRYVNAMVICAGVMSSVLLALVTMLGVVIAAGPSVPGVQRAVSAATWAMLMAVSTIPWKDVLSTIPWPGVFSDYQTMADLSDAVNAGRDAGTKMFATYLGMPLMAAILSCVVALRFRAGVADGVIVQSVNDLEQRLEREMDDIRRRGAAAQNTARAVAALNQAIGDKPLSINSDAPTVVEIPEDDASAPKEASSLAESAARKWGAPRPVTPPKRAI
jgi:hypothetical protein